jgi:hypothetical protein
MKFDENCRFFNAVNASIPAELTHKCIRLISMLLLDAV